MGPGVRATCSVQHATERQEGVGLCSYRAPHPTAVPPCSLREGPWGESTVQLCVRGGWSPPGVLELVCNCACVCVCVCVGVRVRMQKNYLLWLEEIRAMKMAVLRLHPPPCKAKTAVTALTETELAPVSPCTALPNKYKQT